MIAAPNPRTWIDKEIPPYNTINAEVYSTVSWLLQRPMCKVRQTTVQSIPSGTWTAVLFQTEDVDTYNWHNATTNSNRITPNIPGWYRGWWSLSFPGTTGGNFRAAYVQFSNSHGRARRDQKPTPGSFSNSFHGVPFFHQFNGTTDYVELLAFQDSGSALGLPVAAQGSGGGAELFLRWMGPL